MAVRAVPELRLIEGMQESLSTRAEVCEAGKDQQVQGGVRECCRRCALQGEGCAAPTPMLGRTRYRSVAVVLILKATWQGATLRRDAVSRESCVSFITTTTQQRHEPSSGVARRLRWPSDAAVLADGKPNCWTLARRCYLSRGFRPGGGGSCQRCRCTIAAQIMTPGCPSCPDRVSNRHGSLCSSAASQRTSAACIQTRFRLGTQLWTSVLEDAARYSRTGR